MMIYKGVIKDNNSPNKDGRLRVHIPGIHPELGGSGFESIDINHLPWLEVISSQLHKGIGKSSVMDVDTWVHVYVPDDSHDIDRMIVLGSVGNTSIDFHDIAKGLGKDTNNYTASSGPASVNIEGSKDSKSQYPDCTVVYTKGGHLIVIDDTKGNERIKIQNNKGSYIELNENGITQVSSSALNNYIKGELNEYIQKAVNKIFGNAVNIGIDGNTEIGSKNITIDIDGSLKINATGNVNVESDGNVDIQASTIILN